MGNDVVHGSGDSEPSGSLAFDAKRMQGEVADVIAVVAFVFSAMVSVLFGFFPARKAAVVDPIGAQRHE